MIKYLRWETGKTPNGVSGCPKATWALQKHIAWLHKAGPSQESCRSDTTFASFCTDYAATGTMQLLTRSTSVLLRCVSLWKYDVKTVLILEIWGSGDVPTPGRLPLLTEAHTEVPHTGNSSEPLWSQVTSMRWPDGGNAVTLSLLLLFLKLSKGFQILSEN